MALIGNYQPRAVPANPTDQDFMVATWQRQIEDLDFDICVWVVNRHFRRSDEPVTVRGVRRGHQDYVTTEASRRRAGLAPLGPQVPDRMVEPTPLDQITARDAQ